MTEPSSHYTEVNDLRLHYLEAGEGDPILLLHGFPTSSHLYRNILPELAKTHRAIALDLPGYGLSDKPLDATYDYDFYADTLDAFLDALGIGDTHLCVHDLGGPVGLYWMLRHPHRVHKLVVLNTLVYPETSWAVKLFLLAMKTPGLRDYLVSPKGIVATMKLGVVNQGRLNREALTPYTAPFEDPAARKALIKAASALGTAGLAKIARELPAYQGTIRLIYGENDRVTPRHRQNHAPPETRPPPSRAHPPKKLRPLPPRRRTQKSSGAHLRVPQPAVEPPRRATSDATAR